MTIEISRRNLLIGAASLASAGLVAACSSRSRTAATDHTQPSGTDPVLIAVFGAGDQYLVAGCEQRLAFALGDSDGAARLNVPDSLDFQITSDGTPVGDPVTVAAHADGVPIGYYPLRTTFPAPGLYTVTIAGTSASQALQVGDAAKSTLLQAGGQMRPVDTPTLTDAHGVNPICTQPKGPCPFHTQTLTQALGSGRPTVLMVSTPQFCQIGVCGPVLDLLTELAPDFPTVQVTHAEVYANAETILDQTNATSRSGTPAAPTDAIASATLAPVVDAYGLTFEPSLFVADRTGTVVDRLDNVFDRAEIRQALTRIA